MYFKMEMERRFPDEDKVLGHANGEFVFDAKNYFSKIGKGEIIKDVPIFDYFHLESFGPKEEWEWKLQDVHGFISTGSIMGANWYISNDFKILLENFKVAPEYHFYETKLLYKGNKLKYWIFQFTASYRKLNKMQFINFPKTQFSTNKGELYMFNSYEDYSEKNEEIYDKDNEDLEPLKIVLNEFFDFIPLNPLNSDIIISEKLKNAIIRMKLKGVPGQTYPNIKGQIKIVSELDFCSSCRGVIKQFNDMFPEIKLIIINGAR